jgi:hypothetical protein
MPSQTRSSSPSRFLTPYVATPRPLCAAAFEVPAVGAQADRSTVNLQVTRCVRNVPVLSRRTATNVKRSVQVNLPAESGEMGVLAQHVPSIEQLKPGLVEIIEEAGGSKQFFRKRSPTCKFEDKS